MSQCLHPMLPKFIDRISMEEMSSWFIGGSLKAIHQLSDTWRSNVKGLPSHQNSRFRVEGAYNGRTGKSDISIFKQLLNGAYFPFGPKLG